MASSRSLANVLACSAVSSISIGNPRPLIAYTYTRADPSARRPLPTRTSEPSCIGAGGTSNTKPAGSRVEVSRVRSCSAISDISASPLAAHSMNCSAASASSPPLTSDPTAPSRAASSTLPPTRCVCSHRPASGWSRKRVRARQPCPKLSRTHQRRTQRWPDVRHSPRIEWVHLFAPRIRKRLNRRGELPRRSGRYCSRQATVEFCRPVGDLVSQPLNVGTALLGGHIGDRNRLRGAICSAIVLCHLRHAITSTNSPVFGFHCRRR